MIIHTHIYIYYIYTCYITMNIDIYLYAYIYIYYIRELSQILPAGHVCWLEGQLAKCIACSTCQAVGRPKSMSRAHMWRRSSVQGVPFMMM
jgi:hypothetical protein